MVLIFIKGLLLGLSSGIFCLSWCLPMFLPPLLGQKRSIKTSFIFYAKFAGGRLFSYLLFGTVVAYLGMEIANPFLHQLVWLVLIVLSIVIIFNSLGLLKPKSKCGFFSRKISFSRKMPWLLGILLGLNICPPFLLALSYVFNLKSALIGVLFFFCLFLGTTTYQVPFVLLGHFTKVTLFQKMAQVSGILVGVVFLIYGLVNVIH